LFATFHVEVNVVAGLSGGVMSVDVAGRDAA
jgi:hypothetical protein